VFAEGHPLEAAQVLEGLPAAESGAYLAALPARVAAGVVKRMAPQYAARCAETMSESVVTALLEALGPQPASALLHHLPRDQQARALERLPVGTAVAIRLLVGYPQDTAGSCMDPRPLALPPETPVADALEQLKRFEGEPVDMVFVVGTERQVLGAAALVALLRSPPREALSRIMRQPAPTVSALTPLAAVQRHPDWFEVPALAVIERGDRLVGALRRQTLEKVLARDNGFRADQTANEALAGIGGAYWQVLTALAQIAVSVMPPVTPVEPREKDRER